MKQNSISTTDLLDIIIDSLDGNSVAFNKSSEEEWITTEECQALWKDDDDYDFAGAVKQMVLARLPELLQDDVVNKTDEDFGFVNARSAECINTHFDYYVCTNSGLRVAIIND